MLAAFVAMGESADDPERAVQQAIAMGLATKDPLARARLVSVARRAVEGGAPSMNPIEIVGEVQENPGRYQPPSHVRFEQLFLSRSKRGASLEGDAVELAGRLSTEPEAPAASLQDRGDPWPWSNEAAAQDVARLDAMFGAGFGSAVGRAPVGRWTGPMSSSFGLHFVRVVEHVDARPPGPKDVWARAAEAVQTRRRAAHFDETMARIRARYAIVVERLR
jgi:hypothetical protein